MHQAMRSLSVSHSPPCRFYNPNPFAHHPHLLPPLLHPLHGFPPNLDRVLSPVAEGLGNRSPPISYLCMEIKDDLVLLLAIRSLVDGRVESVEPPKGG